MSDPASTLKDWCDNGKLSSATLSSDGSSLSLEGSSLPGKDIISVSHDGRQAEYSVASIYLQILDPDQGLVKYRGACKKHQVGDPVKALDKPVVVGYFLAGSASAAVAAVPPPPAEEPAAREPDKPSGDSAVAGSADTSKTPDHRKEKESSSAASAKKPRPSSSSSSKHHHDKHRKHHDKKRPPSKDKHGDKRKKHKPMVTNEQLFSNLNVVVDKRATAKGDEKENSVPAEELPLLAAQQPRSEEFEAIRKALSPQGFQVTPEMLEASKEITEALTSNEIPVGDSASILRATSAGANLSRVLNIFLETVNPKLAHKKGAITATPIKKNAKPYLIGKKPIILLPKGMTCPITIVNGFDFFSNARYIPRDVMLKNKAQQTNMKKLCFTRKMPGVGLVEFELLDNPRKLHSKEEWERVVAVVVMGHKWQFKDWPGRYSDPVQLFTKCFGFYIGMEGDKLPNDLLGWACKRGKVHRDKRGLDSVTSAMFWNNLDEWMKIHKAELLPHPE
ncbi:cell division cycle 73, Paf1 RNA polymerase II complex component, homolog (Saccharomyces cerevisiae) [Seminavis robusta]|uniref:Cell division cycle 73, Paf1 RNA polymerase II complex component, homolog (Saccharomyces cerevisiae) n=1 Tax=Seminavis robusta TaxID=568900 RepID=A0A9N8HCB4_9STRA|nr:cell division cycle 73, Paf1 RNA polymerase II complex component, homolog (Saccharomyces cerevisiae) [Seminavis robusta]|eukprot:Sro312_g114540.1 cell division cycle 73, Paf1 RNA polymerase II complex component, homolog (Saccharomyces cerevisiae) (505) ;mRNA; r:22701-24215